MTNEGQRSTIEPGNRHSEEASDEENSAGVRQDIGVSSQQPEPESIVPPGSDPDAGRGDLGTLTPGERGSDQNPR